jgi:hypothetical protein
MGSCFFIPGAPRPSGTKLIVKGIQYDSRLVLPPRRRSLPLGQLFENTGLILRCAQPLFESSSAQRDLGEQGPQFFNAQF